MENASKIQIVLLCEAINDNFPDFKLTVIRQDHEMWGGHESF